MAHDMEVAMLERRVEELETAAIMQRSAHITILLDLKVMLQDGDVEQAMEMLQEMTGDE